MPNSTVFVVFAVIVVLAGCTGVGPSPDSNTAAPTNDADTTDADNTPGSTDPADTAESSCTPYDPVAGLDLSVSGGVVAEIEITEAESGTTVVNRTVTGGESAVYHGSSDVFEPRTAYNVSIQTGESTHWNRIIRPTEELVVTVESDGRVTVDEMIVEETPTPCP